jgi:hypothetical protein
MSIQQVQTKNILELITRSLFVNGTNPLTNEILTPLSEFFANNPSGLPYKLPKNRFREGLIGDETDINDLMAFMVANLDTLYETCFDHIDQVMLLNTVLQNHLDRLKKKRARLSSKIDDYLLGIYNSDGYFYSVSDDFNETSFIDFNYTTAFVDTSAGVVTIPSRASGSKLISSDKLVSPNIKVSNSDGQMIGYSTQMPFSNAIDGLSNTAWYIEIKTTENGPIMVEVDIPLATVLGDSKVSRVEITPYGIKPVRASVEAVYLESAITTSRYPFSNYVRTSTDKMIFNANEVRLDVSNIILNLSKESYDYQVKEANGIFNVFVFGLKEILISENAYDLTAEIVTQPLALSEYLDDESSIDGVSLVVNDSLPTGTSIEYFIAPHNPNAETVGNFDWKPISPISSVNTGQQTNVVKFGGSQYVRQIMRRQPKNSNELKLIDFNTSELDLAKRNPTPAYFDTIDVYRLAEFKSPFLAGSLKLEEGINTTKIYHTDLDALAIQNGFSFWKTIFDRNDYITTHGEIDAGYGFLYGGDVGANGRSVYCETYINVDDNTNIIRKDCKKLDSNSSLWTIKVFLNGREVAYLPPGTNKVTVPWKFNKGRNHIAVLANIPEAATNTSPYLGTFDVMANDSLNNYGTVNLDYWTFVDNHKFVNNQLDDAKTFTIYNNELVTRRKPTNNYAISYYMDTNGGPSAVRLRAILTRQNQDSASTPALDSYRVRFSYTED